MRSMWLDQFLVLSAAAALAAFAQADTVRRYVSYRTDGTMPNGDSWATAYHSIQEALDSVGGNNVGEIWVAASETPYKPTKTYPNLGMADQYRTFYIKPGYTVLGGFIGYDDRVDPNNPYLGESDARERNPEVNLTILDGDLLGNDADTAFPDGTTYSDNAYHVVTFSDAPAGTKLSGFVIQHGYASDYQTLFDIGDQNGSIAYDGSGGGILLRWKAETTTEPVLDRLVLRNNYAAVRGGGIAMNGKAEPHIANCEFRGNVVGGYNDTQFNNSVSGGAVRYKRSPTGVGSHIPAHATTHPPR